MASDSHEGKRQGADDLAHADPWDANREVVTRRPAGAPALPGDPVQDRGARVSRRLAQLAAPDPQEKMLIAASRKSADLFAKLRADKPEGKVKALAEGKIESIIHPTLADHVRREAVKFVDELKRV